MRCFRTPVICAVECCECGKIWLEYDGHAVERCPSCNQINFPGDAIVNSENCPDVTRLGDPHLLVVWHEKEDWEITDPFCKTCVGCDGGGDKHCGMYHPRNTKTLFTVDVQPPTPCPECCNFLCRDDSSVSITKCKGFISKGLLACWDEQLH